MTEHQLAVGQIVTFGLALTRCSGFIIASPLWGDATVPSLVKVGLSVALTGVMFDHGNHSVAALTGDAAGHYLAVHVPLEFSLGAILGIVFSLLFVPLRIAGGFVTQEIGLTLGNLTSPGLTEPPPGLGTLIYAAGAFCFLGANLHHGLIVALMLSFDRLPTGEIPWAAWAPWYARELTYAHDLGFVVMGGILVALAATSLFLLFLAKASPMFNLFTVGTSIRLFAGMSAVLVFLPDVVWGIATALSGTLNRLLTFMAS